MDERARGRKREWGAHGTGSSDLRAHIVIVGRSGWACVRAGARACTGARCRGAGGEFGLCALQEGCNVDAALRAGAVRTDDNAVRLEADVAETRHAPEERRAGSR